ncbi:MAG: hypothetical protein U9O87_02335 [Verrucomicrobiota bacterium]|nr:hypothetical protein [Verrucomicrobiota bacterium]
MITKLLKIIEDLVVTDSKQVNILAKLTALAVFYDEKVYENEISKAKEILLEQFDELNLTDTEMELGLSTFDDLLEEYSHNLTKFIEDKRWLNNIMSQISNEERTEFISILKKIFDADGFLGEDEISILFKFQKQQTSLSS